VTVYKKRMPYPNSSSSSKVYQKSITPEVLIDPALGICMSGMYLSLTFQR